MLRLYDAPVSGNAYKARLFLALIGRHYESVPVNLAAGENRRDEFLTLNPRGQIPTLVDGERVVWDSQAILTHLACRYAPGWLPLEASALTEVMQWLAFAQNECLFGLARARAVRLFGRPWDYAQCRGYGEAGLAILDAHLANREWVAGNRASIADLACYPYVALAPEADIDLGPHKHIAAWRQRIESLPGYVDMPGIVPA